MDEQEMIEWEKATDPYLDYHRELFGGGDQEDLQTLRAEEEANEVRQAEENRQREEAGLEPELSQFDLWLKNKEEGNQ